jgi:deoxyribonuclease V
MSTTISTYDHLSLSEAKDIQNNLRENLVFSPLNKPTETIAGADISLNRFSEVIYAGIVILRYSDLQPIAYSLVEGVTRFPYIPGFLAFREIPALLKAWEQIPVKPDVVMVDGQGIAHPRRMGIAAHLGALTNTPTLGCAKKPLFGKWLEPEPDKGSFSPIQDKTETLGYVLRSKNKVKPVFISPGNLLDISGALQIAIHSIKNHRLPEPTRQAHEHVNLFRTGKLQAGYHTVTNDWKLF